MMLFEKCEEKWRSSQRYISGGGGQNQGMLVIGAKQGGN